MHMALRDGPIVLNRPRDVRYESRQNSRQSVCIVFVCSQARPGNALSVNGNATAGQGIFRMTSFRPMLEPQIRTNIIGDICT